MISTNTFSPDFASPPGETLRDVLEMKGISQTDLAVRAGLTEKTISHIINGIAPISYETAERLEMVLGVPARFWNARESQYRESLMRLAEAERLENEIKWLSTIPVKELVDRGYVSPELSKGPLVRDALKFFQVSSVAAWREVWLEPQVQFRGAKSQHAHPGFVAAWVRIGEIAAEHVECAAYNADVFKEAIKAIRKLVTEPASVWRPQMQELCAAAGVAVVFVKEISSAGVSGVTKWLSKDKALIILSLMYKTDDQLWFSFFHEVCHVLKHSKKSVFYETGKVKDSANEAEANRFASEILIPPSHVGRLPQLKRPSDVMAFAKEINSTPGIVVGRLQHDKLIHPGYMSELKKKFKWGMSNES